MKNIFFKGTMAQRQRINEDFFSKIHNMFNRSIDYLTINLSSNRTETYKISKNLPLNARGVGGEIITFFFLFLTLVSCKNQKAQEAPAEAPKAPSNAITVTPTQLKNMDLGFATLSESLVSDEVKVSGMTDVPPENIATITVPINGFIKNLTHNVLEGRFINKGGVLATIQSMEFVQIQQDYLQAISQSILLGKEVERQKTLVEQDASAQKRLQVAEAEFRQNQVLIRALESKLRILNVSPERLKNGGIQTNLLVYSPIAGFIKSANVNIGKNVSPTEVLFEVMSKSHMHIELKVLENDAYKIKQGQKVIISDARLGGEATGKIFLVGKAFSDENKAINVHVHLDKEEIESKLIPKMYVNARILIEPRKTSTLPETAILRENNQTFVFRVKDKTSFEKIPVKVGTIQNGKAEVIFSEVIAPQTQFVSKGINTVVGMDNSGEE